MSAKLLSVAAIARELNVPESTLHYWKNRFAQFLPSVGRGRQKRFRPEALSVFRIIADLLGQGLSTTDIRTQLAERLPMTVEPSAQTAVPLETAVQPPASLDDQLRIAATVGAEIAKALGEKLGQALELACGGRLPALAEALGDTTARLNTQGIELRALREENARLTERITTLETALAQADRPTPPMASETPDVGGKLTVLEAELVRLRKDRREMERYLLEKIDALRKTEG